MLILMIDDKLLPFLIALKLTLRKCLGIALHRLPMKSLYELSWISPSLLLKLLFQKLPVHLNSLTVPIISSSSSCAFICNDVTVFNNLYLIECFLRTYSRSFLFCLYVLFAHVVQRGVLPLYSSIISYNSHSVCGSCHCYIVKMLVHAEIVFLCFCCRRAFSKITWRRYLDIIKLNILHLSKLFHRHALLILFAVLFCSSNVSFIHYHISKCRALRLVCSHCISKIKYLFLDNRMLHLTWILFIFYPHIFIYDIIIYE